VRDLDDDDEGWTLITSQGKKGIIPTQYYEGLSHEVKLPPINSPMFNRSNQWKMQFSLKSLTNLQPDVQLKGPVSITWCTRKKTGNTGTINFPSDSSVAAVNKSYDIVEEFIPSEKPGFYKGKYLRVQIKYDNAEPEVLSILLNSYISAKDQMTHEREVPVKWCDDHSNCHLLYSLKTTPIKMN
jgi:hypothetical protein